MDTKKPDDSIPVASYQRPSSIIVENTPIKPSRVTFTYNPVALQSGQNVQTLSVPTSTVVTKTVVEETKKNVVQNVNYKGGR